MVTWNNLNTLASFQALSETERVDLVSAMTGENGAERVKNYSIPMAAGLVYNYAAKQVDGKVLDGLVKLAEEAQLGEKFTALYNGEVINTGEKRLVLHQLQPQPASCLSSLRRAERGCEDRAPSCSDCR